MTTNFSLIGRPTTGSVVLAAFLLVSCAICNCQARSCPHYSAEVNVEQFSVKLRAAFAAMPARYSSAAEAQAATCGLRTRLGLLAQSRRASLHPFSAGLSLLRAKQEDDGDLKNEFQELLGKSGRDRGMKEMKAPKGSVEWLKQQQNIKGPVRPTAPAANPVAGASPSAGAPPLAGPPAKPKLQAPAPSYQDLDALLSGKAPTTKPPAKVVPELVAPAARPAYSVGATNDMVALASFDKGDAVPQAAWDALVDAQGQSLSLSKFAEDGGELLVVVPEVGKHTGAPSETWTKLLIDLQNTLGSRPERVRAVAVSPESNEVHAKMMSRYNLKLFLFASDAERRFMATHKVWDPAAARRGVSVERQTFVIDLQTGKFAHVFHAVPAVGHAAAVRDVLEALLLSKDAARNPAATASASPATAPAPAQPQAPAPLAAAPVSLKPPAPKPSAPKDPLPKPSASSESQPALPPRSTAAAVRAAATEGGGEAGAVDSMVVARAPVPRSEAGIDAGVKREKELDVSTQEAEEEFVLENVGARAPVESVGPLIGRGGARVQELSARSGARIRFENEPSPRMFARGAPAQRAAAFAIVQEWIRSSGMERVRLPLDVHGRIIGSRGSKVKDIEMVTRAHIVFEREPEAAMVVRGNETERAAAIAMVMDIIASFEVEEEKVELGDVSDLSQVRAVLGFKGAFVKSVEEKSRVKVRYNLSQEDKDKVLILLGTKDQRTAAKELIAAHLAEIKEVSTHNLDEDEMRSLMGYKGQVIHRLEEGSGAIISMNQDKVDEDKGVLLDEGKAGGEAGGKQKVAKQMLIRGTPQQRARAWELAEEVLLMDAVETHDIPSQKRRVIVGPNGTVVKYIEAATGAGITLLNHKSNTSRLLVRGPKPARAAAWNMIQEMIYSQEGVERVLVDRRCGSELLRNKARVCKDLELATGTVISIEKETASASAASAASAASGASSVSRNAADDGMVAVLVRGLRQQRDIVKEALADMQSDAPQKVLLKDLAPEGAGEDAGADISILDVRRIIGPRGSRVAQMEEETGASIRLEVEPVPSVSVRGTRAQKDAALALICLSLSKKDDEEAVELAEALHGVVIGVSGRSVQQIESSSGAQVSFRQGPKPAMLLRGDAQQRAKAKELAIDLLASDTAEYFKVGDMEASALIGAKGRNIRDIESATGARVQVVTFNSKSYPSKVSMPLVEQELAALKPGEVLVIIKGKDEQREKARKLVMLSAEAEDADAERPLAPAEAEILLALNENVRREIQERTGARLMLNALKDGVVVFGKAAQRAAAQELLQSEFAFEEERRDVKGEFPLLMLRLIVGAGGGNVRNLEAATGARIRFETLGDSRDASTRVCLRVRGSAEGRAKAFALIEAEQAAYEEERMPLQVRKHYVLIGKGGEVIKSLEGETNTAICFTQTPEAAMVVLGTADNRARAIEMAKKRLAGLVESEQHVFQVPRKFHAELIGSSGRNIQAIEARSGAHIHFRGDESDDCVVTGTQEQRDKAWAIIQEAIDSGQESRLEVAGELHRLLIGPRGTTIRDLESQSGARLSFDLEPPSLVARGPPAARERALQLAKQVLQDDKEEHFYVETRYHGWLIGPRGSRIRDIEEETGTRVIMSRTEPVVVVEGSRARREKAWDLIQAQMDLMDEVSGDAVADDARPEAPL